MQYNTIQMNRFTWIETEIHSMQPSFNTINLSFFKQTLSRLDYIFVMSLWTKYIYKYQRSFFFSLFSFKPYCNLAMNQPIWTIQKKNNKLFNNMKLSCHSIEYVVFLFS